MGLESSTQTSKTMPNFVKRRHAWTPDARERVRAARMVRNKSGNHWFCSQHFASQSFNYNYHYSNHKSIHSFARLSCYCMYSTRPQCKYAVLPIHVDSHLSDVRHNYNKEQQEQVILEISQIEGLIQDAKGLESSAFPKPSSLAIPELKPAMSDGLQCRQCLYICRNKRKMQGHCK